MPRRKADLEKHTMNFYSGDFDRVRLLHPGLDVGLVIRTILHQYCDAEETKAPTQRVALEVTELEDV